MTERKRSIPAAAASLVYLLAVTALLYGLFSHWAYDDPFITYRYAQNLAHGQGLVYNPSERVLSTTTPLFALLLAALSPLGFDLPGMANLAGCFSLALGGLFFWHLAQAWKTPFVGWTGLLLYPTFPLLLTTLGSETPIYLAFCLGAFACYARGRYAWTSALAALAVLARPDGALVPILLGADYLFRVRRPIPWAAVLIFGVLTLPWFGFAWAYYGSPLPVTLAVKQQQGAMVISQRFAPGFLSLARDYARWWQYLVGAGLALLGIFYLARSARRWALFLAWTVLYFTAYSVLGVSRYYWYYAPLVPGFLALVGLGLEALEKWMADDGRQTIDDRQQNAIRRLSSVVRRQAVFVLLLLLAAAQAAGMFQLRQQYDRRAVIYRHVGEWLRENTAPGDLVGALEVGIVGYYAQRPMVDFAGLLQPEIASRLGTRTTYEDAAVWAAERFHPNYLILNKGDFPRLEAGYAAEHCRVIQRFPGKPYGYPGRLLVFVCNSTGDPE